MLANPPWQPDSKRLIETPFNLNNWINQNRSEIKKEGSKRLFDTSYQSDVIVLGLGSGPRKITSKGKLEYLNFLSLLDHSNSAQNWPFSPFRHAIVAVLLATLDLESQYWASTPSHQISANNSTPLRYSKKTSEFGYYSGTNIESNRGL